MNFGRGTGTERVKVLIDDQVFFEGVLEEIRATRDAVEVPDDKGWMIQRATGHVHIEIQAMIDRKAS